MRNVKKSENRFNLRSVIQDSALFASVFLFLGLLPACMTCFSDYQINQLGVSWDDNFADGFAGNEFLNIRIG